jgi:hypothetical protein
MVKEHALQRNAYSKVLERQTRLANKDKSAIEREWEVLRTVGMETAIRDLVTYPAFQASHGLTENELVDSWNTFIDESLLIVKAILEDLAIEAPEEVFFDHFSAEAQTRIASMTISEFGDHVLKFSSVPLQMFFLRYLGTIKSKSFQRKNAWYKFQAMLAHELRHLKQHRRFLSVSERNGKKPYFERLTEYDARLYSFHWLRKQRGVSFSEKFGLWLARLDILFDDVFPFFEVRDRVNHVFGVKTPSIVDGIRKIFTAI